MVVYGHASRLSGLGGDAESQQLVCGEAYGSPAQYVVVYCTSHRTTKTNRC
jgi:hypothetical protein